MGHQHYSTTQRYLHHKPRREDAAKLAEAFEPEDGYQSGTNLEATQTNSEQEPTPEQGCRAGETNATFGLQSRLRRFDSGRRLSLDQAINGMGKPYSVSFGERLTTAQGR